MADIAISYAHSTHEEAVALREALQGLGVTVWMDDPGDHDALQVGIPIGQSHWEVIEREFAAASYIAVLDSPDWRQRDYCQREYRRCRELGKPISFVQPDAPADAASSLVALLNAEHDLLEAHARLALRYVTPTGASGSWLQRMAAGRTATDAWAVLTTEEAPFSVTPLIREVVEEDLTRANRIRRQLRRAATVGGAVFSVLAVVASVAWYLASVWLGEATEARARAEAAELVDNSYAAVDTIEAVSLAARAVELNPAPETLEALEAAELRDGRVRVLEVPTDEYRGAAWSADNDIVYLYTRHTIVSADAVSGAVSPVVEVERPIRTGALVGSSALGVLYVDTSGALHRVDPTTGAVELLDDTTNFSTIALHEDGTLVGSGRAGALYTMAVEDGAVQLRSAVALPHHARAIDTAGDTVAALDDEGWLRSFSIVHGVLEEAGSVRVTESRLAESGSWLRSNVTVCGSSYVGSFVTGLMGVKFSWDPAEAMPDTERSVQITAPVCSEEAALKTTLTRGGVEELFGERSIQLPADVYQLWSARDPRHERVAYVSPLPGRLLVINPASAITEEDLGPALAVLQLDRATLLVGEDGAVTDLDTGESFGSIPSYPTMRVRQGCNALIVTGYGLHHVSFDSPVRAVGHVEEFSGLQAAANGEDFVVSRFKSVDIHGPDGELRQQIDLGWVGNDSVTEADLSPDGGRIAFVTVSGHVHEVPIDAPAAGNVIGSVPGGNFSLIAYLPDGSGLAVVGTDGRLRRFDAEGVLSGSRQLDFRPDSLLTDGEYLLAISHTEGSAIISQDTLSVVERFPVGALMTATGQEERLAFIARQSNSTLVTIPSVARPLPSPPPTQTQRPTSSEPESEAPPVEGPAETVLSFGSVGPIQPIGVDQINLGDTAQHLGGLGAAVDGMCGWGSSESLGDVGVWLGFDVDVRLFSITVVDEAIRTEDGARVGMTIREVAQLYGDRFTVETKNGNGGPFEAGVVRREQLELVFMISWDDGSLTDDSLVHTITLQEYTTDMFGEC